MARCKPAFRGHSTPCWEWQGADSGKSGRGAGYPRMSLDGATVAVHIAAWVNANGLIPPRKQLDHLCCNRICVRPDHLELVTAKRNAQRRSRKLHKAAQHSAQVGGAEGECRC